MLDGGHGMSQSTYLPVHLPAWWRALRLTISILVVAAAPALGQQTYRVRRAENFRRDPSPNGVLLAAVSEGSMLTGGALQGGWVQVTLEGWIWARSTAPTTREGHDRVVTARGGENLREVPNGRIVALMSNGALLDEADTRSGWVRVRRTGWMWARSLDLQDTEEDAAGVASSGGLVAEERPGLDRAVAAQEASLHRTPDGTGTLAPEAPVRIMARSGEWVRIQTEGWVRESELRPAAPGVLVGVSAAEVRSRPAEFEGQMVQWVIQTISIQEADELRGGIPRGRRYVLARGPLPEAGFLYIIVSDEQVAELERLPPLAELVIIGRIRVGRSRYLGNPILELVEMAVREE